MRRILMLLIVLVCGACAESSPLDPSPLNAPGKPMVEPTPLNPPQVP